jgi:hypothetical protein
MYCPRNALSSPRVFVFFTQVYVFGTFFFPYVDPYFVAGVPLGTGSLIHHESFRDLKKASTAG